MKVLLTLTILAAALATTHGLKCYTCNATETFVGSKDPCADEFDPKENENALLECSSEQKFCRKEKNGLNNIITVYDRRCAEQCEDQNDAHLARVDCCKGDGCNAGSYLTSTLFITLLAFSFAIFF